MACTFSPNLYLKAQDGHNCDASLWINEQGHISAEPLEMFLWEIRITPDFLRTFGFRV